jgi:hypothetical protein
MGAHLPRVPLLSVQPLSAREDNGQKIPPFQREAMSHRPRALQLTLSIIAQKEEVGGDAYNISWMVSQIVLEVFD